MESNKTDDPYCSRMLWSQEGSVILAIFKLSEPHSIGVYSIVFRNRAIDMANCYTASSLEVYSKQKSSGQHSTNVRIDLESRPRPATVTPSQGLHKTLRGIGPCTDSQFGVCIQLNYLGMEMRSQRLLDS